ncbi:hypothetical protein [Rhodoferax sp. UBA5149]|uniref:hypothetical protein n=1 Tax=Rhodoferax sp. UBA5149 TaxID=1947379 RepID=UPI0025FABDF9|nr:hypothetical protein [Rhodoferax sp. UBA5149]
MKTNLAKLFIYALIALPVISHADADKRTPSEKYQGAISFALSMCTFAFIEAQAGGRQETQSCIDDGRVSIKKEYDSFSKLIKKPPAKSALKEHYIAGISALNGIQPQTQERKFNYDKRQGDNQAKIDDLWVRFETEN